MCNESLGLRSVISCKYVFYYSYIGIFTCDRQHRDDMAASFRLARPRIALNQNKYICPADVKDPLAKKELVFVSEEFIADEEVSAKSWKEGEKIKKAAKPKKTNKKQLTVVGKQELLRLQQQTPGAKLLAKAMMEKPSRPVAVK
ncbi:unnamed protein product [Caenorhabditis bovis]|uniref:Uncharacterized protein n=1 Tax=Caenorhabditis bovis TaxID=2654633 RepID=A0A8S1F1I2_9PELO|nr:unnamed protein product [Caenorhabditis bovis]